MKGNILHFPHTQKTGKQKLYQFLGFFFLGCGIAGAFLPVMPTTIFLILSSSYFSKSSPRWRAYIYSFPKVGQSVKLWDDHGVITPRSKRNATLGMLFVYVLTCLVVPVHVAFIIGGVEALVLWFIWTRPAAVVQSPQQAVVPPKAA